VSRLFQGIVVAGTALGCGGRFSERQSSEREPASGVEPTDAQAAPSRAAITPLDCDHTEQFACADFDLFYDCVLSGSCTPTDATGDCRCEGDRPSSALDCDAPEQFTCESLIYDGHRIGCRCDTAAPTGPGECDRPEQFRCAAPAPRSGCVCDLQAPSSASDCSDLERFECQSYDPPVGCICTSTTIVR
jgi:hypothetical protein